MENHIWSAFAVVSLTFISLYFVTKIFRRKSPKLPPGPKPWPVIGNLRQVSHASIHQLSQKYGPIMQLQFGSYPLVVGSSIEMAKIFLKTMDINFVSRPKTAAGKYTNYNYSNITWSQYGPYWRQARKICATELFSAKRLESYEYIRAEEMNSLLKEVFIKSLGEPFVLKDYVSTMNLNVISRMALGKRYPDENDIVSHDEFKEMLNEWLFLNGVMNIGDFIPYLNFLDLQGYVKRMKIVSKKLDRVLEHVLDEHEDRRKKTKNYVSGDMVDVLLDVAEDPNLEVKLERNGVKAFTQDMFARGTGSSSIAVEWAFSELIKKPDMVEKAIQELNRFVGQNKWVNEKDLCNLPYIDAIVKETMRLHPVGPLLTYHLAQEDCKVAGYDIKKGTLVLVNIGTIQRDPLVWENPYEFDPERFIGKDIDVKGHDFEFLPFGSGRRICPGYALAMKLMQLSLANLLHGFNWRLPDNMMPEQVDMEETFGFVSSRKSPLVTVVEPRLPLHLYSL